MAIPLDPEQFRPPLDPFMDLSLAKGPLVSGASAEREERVSERWQSRCWTSARVREGEPRSTV